MGPRPEFSSRRRRSWSTAWSTSSAGIAARRSSRSMRRPARCSGCTARTKASAPSARRASCPGAALAYWTDGREERIIYVTPGYRLVALDAKTGTPIAGFGKNGVVDLKLEDDQTHRSRRPARSACSGAGGREGHHHRRRRVPRRHDAARVRTTQGLRPRLRRAHRQAAVDLPHHPAEGRIRRRHLAERLGWTTPATPASGRRSSVDEELGLAYLPVESPTGDYYGGHRPGNNLFAESLVCVDLKTGQRKWHYQFVHHRCGTSIISSRADSGGHHGQRPRDQGGRAAEQAGVPLCLRSRDRSAGLADRRAARAEGRRAGRVVFADAAISDQAAGLRSPGRVAADDLLDFTPALHGAGATRFVSKYKLGPLFTPPVVSKPDGPLATLTLAGALGGTNWPGGSYDPETHTVYASRPTSRSSWA